ALVRSEIRRTRPLRAQEPTGPYRAMISLGEDDPSGLTIPLATQLLAISRLDRVCLVVRPNHPQAEQAQQLAEAHPDQAELAREPAEMAARLQRCHFALTSGCSWSLELACVGIPQLVVVQSEAHWPTAQRLEEEGAATCLGWHASVSPQTIRQAVLQLL